MKKLLVLILSFFFATPLLAFTVSAPSADLEQHYRSLIDEAFSRLPEKIRQEIPQKLQFRLTSYAKYKAHYSKDLVIGLDQDLLQQYISNPKKENFVPFTRHDNFRKYLVAALIHEMTHAFDDLAVKPEERRNGQKWQSLCSAGFANNPQEGRANPYCLSAENFKGRLSGDPEFLNLIYFYFLGSSPTYRERGNFLEKRSMDPYEFRSPEEALAISMEFFLLDESFQCRMPLHYKYLSEKLTHKPFSPQNCQGFGPQFYLTHRTDNDGTFQPRVVRPKGRLYQIHYLMAGAGQGVISRFGHSMLRLVYCKPERTVADEKCLYDLEENIVLTPAAGVPHLELSVTAGLTGGYSSSLFAQKLPETLVMYNRVEEREVFSVPLKLTAEQLKTVEASLLEIHWNYQSKYFYLTNNCATEVLNALKRSLPENFDLQSVFQTMPMNLYKNLNEVGLIDRLDLAQVRQDKTKKYYFPSSQEMMKKIETHLNTQLNINTSVGYMSLGLDDRKRIVEKVKQSGAQRSNLASAVSYLESNIQMRLHLKVNEKLTEILAKTKSVSQKEMISRLQSQITDWFTPDSILSSKSYGLPSAQEITEQIELRQTSIANLSKSQKEVIGFIDNVMEDMPEYKEIVQSRQMIKELN